MTSSFYNIPIKYFEKLISIDSGIVYIFTTVRTSANAIVSKPIFKTPQKKY